MSQDKDVNLLPPNLRSREESERQKPVQPAPLPKYSRPSVLAERLQEAEAQNFSWWDKVKSWFNKVPDITKVAPVKETLDKLDKDLKPDKKPKLKMKVVKPSWFKKLFNPTPAVGLVKKEVKTKPKIAPPPIPKAEVSQGVLSPTPPEVPVGVVLDVNLLPLNSRVSRVPFYLNRLGLVALGAALFAGLLYGVVVTLITLEQVEVKKVQDEAKALAQQIESAKDDLAELEQISQRMILIRDLVAKRPDWLKFFSKLEELTLPNVRYSSVSVTRDGVVVLPAQAYSVSDIAQQLKIWQQAKDVIAEVTIGNVGVGEDMEEGKVLVTSSFQLKLIPGWLSTE